MDHTPRMRWSIALLCASALLLLCLPAGALATEPPLPESDYSAHPACAIPARGEAGCLALELQPSTAAARARAGLPESQALSSEAEHGALLARIRTPGGAGSPLARSSVPLGPANTPLGQVGAPQTHPRTAAQCELKYSPACLAPAELRDAYFPSEAPEAPAGEPQTIALVDAYNDPQAQTDLEAYEREFAISGCPASSSACFEQVNQKGETGKPPFPASELEREAELALCEDTHATRHTRELACHEVVEAEGWAVEISTDIEMARAICHNCKVILVEADSEEYSDLEAAERAAEGLGADEISNSWGGAEPASEGSAFDHPATAITASAGDSGYLNWTEAEEAETAKQECLAEAKDASERATCDEISYYVGADYPASSPHVVAVGGTKLTVADSARSSETVWNEDPDPDGYNNGAGGGGCSEAFPAPSWQLAVPDWAQVGCGTNRAVADIAADADPYTGVAVYDTVPDFGEEDGKLTNEPLYWWPIGGTSVASPIIASMFALAGGAHGVPYPAQTLYSHLGTTSLYTVTKGGNGRCDDAYGSCSGSLEHKSLLYPFDCGEGSLICNAAPGCGDLYYAGPTGVGTPNGVAAFKHEDEPQIAESACSPAKESQTPEEGPSTGPGSGSSSTSTGKSSTGPTSTTVTAPSQQTPSTSSNDTQGGQPSQQHTASAGGATRVLSLTLTASAHSALRHSRPAVAQIGFSFTLSRAVRVLVTLAQQVVERDGRTHWRTLHVSLAFDAAAGTNRRHLQGTAALAPGLYRLTVTPAGGGAGRSLQVRVR